MPNVGIIILAAGGSTRLGKPKQLLEYGGTTLLQHAIDVARRSRCRPCIMVLGANAEIIRPRINAAGIKIVENHAWAEGLSASVRTGMIALHQHNPRLDGVVIMTCDQPFVSELLVRRIVDRFNAFACKIVACDYADTVGVPAAFHRDLFPELTNLFGDKGAKTLIEIYATETKIVDFPDGAIDIDAAQEYKQLLQAEPQPESTIH